MKVLVIDDEKNVRRIVGDYLRNEGYDVIDGIIFQLFAMTERLI